MKATLGLGGRAIGSGGGAWEEGGAGGLGVKLLTKKKTDWNDVYITKKPAQIQV